jgi:cell division protein FtsB
MRKRRRPSRSTIVLRWLAVGALALVAFLYYRPLHSYFGTKAALAQRRAEVAHLRVEHRKLERRLTESTSTGTLERRARRLGLVRPGERLFIVKGIKSWVRKHERGATTIGRNG